LGPDSRIFQFAEWFEQTREEDATSKIRRTLASTPKALRVEAKQHQELALQKKIYSFLNFRRKLREVLQSNMGYMPSDLEGVEYYNLGFDPRQLLKSRSIDTLQLMMQDLSDSRKFWELITACIKGFELAPLMDLKGPVIRNKRPLRLLGFGRSNALSTETWAD
jgi:hypothetical protein